MTKREQLIVWLGDAHAMEVGIISTLEKQIADAKGHPKVRAALANHLKETKRHAKDMKQALAAMGGSHPYFKEGASKLINLAAGLIPTAAPDTIVKNAIAGYATENFEIACYTSLVLTATALGEKQIAATCKQILKEEKAMATLLAGQMQYVNDTYLASLEDDKSEEAPAKPAPKAKKSAKKTATKKAAK